MRTRIRAYELDGVHVESVMRGHDFAHALAREADVVICHAGDGDYGAGLVAGTDAKLVTMVHGHGYNAIHPATSLAVFNSQSLRKKAQWTGPSVVCHPPTWPQDHHVPRRGSSITIVNCSVAKGIKVAWRIAEVMPERTFLGVLGGYGNQIKPRARNFAVIPTTKDMRTVWSRTRVLLVPSAYETWGMVGVEAMCSGIPVIAHPTPGLRESLGDAGIFVDRDDTDGWVEQIRRLDDPDEYATASALALARSAQLDPIDSLDRFAHAVEALCP